MDIDSLKDKLGDETFAALKTYVSDLVGQRDTARNESISGRKKLKSDLDAAHAVVAKALEKLGVENLEELETLPDAKGQGEALKQTETKLKRAERERAEALQQRDEALGKYRTSLQRAAIADALGGHEFVDRDVVESYVERRLVWEADELMFKTDDGKLVGVKDGVAGVAKAKPGLLKPTGTGGAGVRQSNASGGGGMKTLTRNEYAAMTPEAKAAIDWKAVSLTD